MKEGFIKVGVGTPKVVVGDVRFHVEEIKKQMQEGESQGIKLLAFPELCLTGATCGDLFFQEVLLQAAYKGLLELVEASKNYDMVCFVGLPLLHQGGLYNVSVGIQKGNILGVVPKSCLTPEERRYFLEPREEVEILKIEHQEIPFGKYLLFSEKKWEGCKIGVLLGEVWEVPRGEGDALVRSGATILVNPTASPHVQGDAILRRERVIHQSLRLHCGYLYVNCGEGESTTDFVYSGQSLIGEMGEILAEGLPFHKDGIWATEIDVSILQYKRRKKGILPENQGKKVIFELEMTPTKLTRKFSKYPFLSEKKPEVWKEIFGLQSRGLKKRLAHAQAKTAVLGLSGGLDSTLALLVTVQAFDDLEWDRKQIIAITMPCFGTTNRTYQNACKMAECLGVTLKEISIKEAVLQHFKDIGQDIGDHSVTYENAQARERTQVLMDVANQMGGLVIGTGDLSELALGWATYNGDHMSMYGVNGSIPKTMVRHLVEYYADQSERKELSLILRDVLDTPVSPELLPPKEGEIAQKTEDLVGPYELHDFFLYHFIESGYSPVKIFRLAKEVFQKEYKEDFILKWENVFFKRFFTQQFKRSCVPDGPKVGRVGLSPRGDFRMPSDGVCNVWLEELEWTNN